MQVGEEHRLIGDAAQSLLSETAGLERLRAVVEDPSGWDAPLWSARVTPPSLATTQKKYKWR